MEGIASYERSKHIFSLPQSGLQIAILKKSAIL